MTNALVYCRISRDPDGTALGVERQRGDCLELCEKRGWNVTDVLVDNDISAYSGKPRPGYIRAMEGLKEGRADVFVAWHPDRIHRSPRELEDFVDLVESTGAIVATVTAGDVDLGTPEGRLHARIIGAVARKESEDKSRRLRRKHDEIAATGKANGGRRAFGYKADRVTVDPAEAKLVREAAQRVLAGDSLYSIMNDWTDREIPTVTGAKWSGTALKTMLMSPRLAGLRSHRGEIVGPGEWEPILDRDTWEAVKAVLVKRSRGRTRAPRSYLLSGGIARCAHCGHHLIAAPRPTGRAYACLKSNGGCNGVSIMAEPVEELVTDALFDVVDDADLATMFAPREPVPEEADLVDIEERLGDVAELYADGEISRAEWMRAKTRLEERRAEAAPAVAEARAPSPAIEFVGKPGALRAAWPKLSLDRQRTILGSVVSEVTITSGGRGGARVDLDRVNMTWRT